MKAGVIFSILFAIALIGGAFWNRTNNTKISPNGVLVSKSGPKYDASELQEYINLNPSTTTSETIAPANNDGLNNSQAIGRSLIADYVNLAASGKATDANIEAIAEKYVSLVPTLNKPQVLSLRELNIVSDSQAGFKSYGTGVAVAHQAFGTAISKISKKKYTFSETSSDLYLVMKAFNQGYVALADKLKAMPVPESVKAEHLDLVNSYLESASATSVITPEQSDYALFFSALLTFKQNVDKQELLLNKISKILTAHGI